MLSAREHALGIFNAIPLGTGRVCHPQHGHWPGVDRLCRRDGGGHRRTAENDRHRREGDHGRARRGPAGSAGEPSDEALRRMAEHLAVVRATVGRSRPPRLTQRGAV